MSTPHPHDVTVSPGNPSTPGKPLTIGSLDDLPPPPPRPCFLAVYASTPYIPGLSGYWMFRSFDASNRSLHAAVLGSSDYSRTLIDYSPTSLLSKVSKHYPTSPGLTYTAPSSLISTSHILPRPDFPLLFRSATSDSKSPPYALSTLTLPKTFPSSTLPLQLVVFDAPVIATSNPQEILALVREHGSLRVLPSINSSLDPSTFPPTLYRLASTRPPSMPVLGASRSWKKRRKSRASTAQARIRAALIIPEDLLYEVHKSLSTLSWAPSTLVSSTTPLRSRLSYNFLSPFGSNGYSVRLTPGTYLSLSSYGYAKRPRDVFTNNVLGFARRLQQLTEPNPFPGPFRTYLTYLRVTNQLPAFIDAFSPFMTWLPAIREGLGRYNSKTLDHALVNIRRYLYPLQLRPLPLSKIPASWAPFLTPEYLSRVYKDAFTPLESARLFKDPDKESTR